jgi:hypothetical protein
MARIIYVLLALFILPHAESEVDHSDDVCPDTQDAYTAVFKSRRLVQQIGVSDPADLSKCLVDRSNCADSVYASVSDVPGSAGIAEMLKVLVTEVVVGLLSDMPGDSGRKARGLAATIKLFTNPAGTNDFCDEPDLAAEVKKSLVTKTIAGPKSNNSDAGIVAKMEKLVEISVEGVLFSGCSRPDEDVPLSVEKSGNADVDEFPGMRTTYEYLNNACSEQSQLTQYQWDVISASMDIAKDVVQTYGLGHNPVMPEPVQALYDMLVGYETGESSKLFTVDEDERATTINPLDEDCKFEGSNSTAMQDRVLELMKKFGVDATKQKYWGDQSHVDRGETWEDVREQLLFGFMEGELLGDQAAFFELLYMKLEKLYSAAYSSEVEVQSAWISKIGMVLLLFFHMQLDATLTVAEIARQSEFITRFFVMNSIWAVNKDLQEFDVNYADPSCAPDCEKFLLMDADTKKQMKLENVVFGTQVLALSALTVFGRQENTEMASMNHCQEFNQWYAGLYTVWNWRFSEGYFESVPNAHMRASTHALAYPLVASYDSNGGMGTWLLHRVGTLALSVIYGLELALAQEPPEVSEMKTTAECLLSLVNAKASCVSFLAGLPSAGPPSALSSDCFADVLYLLQEEIVGDARCRCNPAIQRLIPGLPSVGCGPIESTYEYGCAESDQAVDEMRFAMAQRFSDLIKLPREQMVAEMDEMFSEHATLTFIGAGIYHGIEQVKEYVLILNPVVSDGFFLFGELLQWVKLEINAAGMHSGILGRVNLLMDVLPEDLRDQPWDTKYQHFVDTARVKLVMGTRRYTEYYPCSAKIKQLTLMNDEITYTSFFNLQVISPLHNENKYCQTIMDLCIGEHKQFDSYDECLNFNKQIPFLDPSCIAPGMLGLGHSRACRIIHQYMVWSNSAHCYHTGIGGLDPEGGSHCFEGECDTEVVQAGFATSGVNDTEVAYWRQYFKDLGSHECVDGIWKASEYLYRWSRPTVAAILAGGGDLNVKAEFACLILGETAFFKLFDETNVGHRNFTYVSGRGEFDGSLVYIFSKRPDFVVSVTLTVGGYTLVDVQIQLGFSRCLPLWDSEVCISWKHNEISLPDDAPPLQIYWTVDGNITKSFDLWKPKNRELPCGGAANSSAPSTELCATVNQPDDVCPGTQDEFTAVYKSRSLVQQIGMSDPADLSKCLVNRINCGDSVYAFLSDVPGSTRIADKLKALVTDVFVGLLSDMQGDSGRKARGLAATIKLFTNPAGTNNFCDEPDLAAEVKKSLVKKTIEGPKSNNSDAGIVAKMEKLVGISVEGVLFSGCNRPDEDVPISVEQSGNADVDEFPGMRTTHKYVNNACSEKPQLTQYQWDVISASMDIAKDVVQTYGLGHNPVMPEPVQALYDMLVDYDTGASSKLFTVEEEERATTINPLDDECKFKGSDSTAMLDRMLVLMKKFGVDATKQRYWGDQSHVDRGETWADVREQLLFGFMEGELLGDQDAFFDLLWMKLESLYTAAYSSEVEVQSAWISKIGMILLLFFHLQLDATLTAAEIARQSEFITRFFVMNSIWAVNKDLMEFDVHYADPSCAPDCEKFLLMDADTKKQMKLENVVFGTQVLALSALTVFGRQENAEIASMDNCQEFNRWYAGLYTVWNWRFSEGYFESVPNANMRASTMHLRIHWWRHMRAVVAWARGFSTVWVLLL